MKRYQIALAIGMTFIASLAYGHVRIQPRESALGARQTYTVVVPTEGDSATTSVELEVPDGVSVLSVSGQAETKKIGNRIVSILWAVEIPPSQARELVFEAMNPNSGQEIVWKAHQRFMDGSRSDWVEIPATSRRPAPITKLGASKP